MDEALEWLSPPSRAYAVKLKAIWELPFSFSGPLLWGVKRAPALLDSQLQVQAVSSVPFLLMQPGHCRSLVRCLNPMTPCLL